MQYLSVPVGRMHWAILPPGQRENSDLARRTTSLSWKTGWS